MDGAGAFNRSLGFEEVFIVASSQENKRNVFGLL